MANFEPKPWTNPFGKMSVFRLFELVHLDDQTQPTFEMIPGFKPFTVFFYSLERRFFLLEYHKTHFPCLYCLKNKVEKWPILDQNHGLTPLEKCQFFDFLKLLFL